MMFKGVKGLIKSIKFNSISVNVGFMGLNFTGSSSYVNDTDIDLITERGVSCGLF